MFSMTTRALVISATESSGRENQYGERRQSQRQRMSAAVGGQGRGFDETEVADATPAVFARVAVQAFAPLTPARDADAVVVARNRREITEHDGDVVRIVAFAHEGQRAVLRVVAIDPLEAIGREVALIQGRRLPIDG